MSARRLSVLGLLVVSICGTVYAADEKKSDYPPTRRVEQIDDYHGTKVADPYRWLENDVRTDREVADWVAAQNQVTEAFLREIPERLPIKQRLTDIWNYERWSTPFKQGGRYFFSRNDGLQNQSVLYVLDALDAEPRVLLDPNTWTKDGTQALAGLSVSDDGRYLAYSVAEAGSDWQTWRILDIDSGKVLADEIKWVKFSGAAWTRDNKGFFYCRYPEPKPGEKFQSLNLNMQMYYHRLGTPQSEDVLVHHRPDQPKWTFQGGVTEDGRYFVLYTNAGGTSARFRVAYRDLAEPLGTFIEIVDNFENEYRLIGNEGPVFYFKTDYQAPRGRVIAVDLRKPGRDHWQQIIPEAQESLRSVSYVGGLFVCTYLKDAASQIKIYRPDGRFVRDVNLPGVGTASGFDGKSTDLETFYSFSSFAVPPTIYRYDLLTGESTLFRQAKVKFDPSAYETRQVFYESKDGTRVPMFITARKGLKLDGSHPTLLYGYGGFNIPMTPSFSPARVAWLEMGGVYAVACLRGGGEYGKEWHLAGTKLKKQNVFDDFIAAAEYLIREKYTRPDKLAIQGGSNGGLLVGAVMCQRPELFGACLPAVGVMDMLRFHKFTAGRFWVDDYGSPDNPEEFKALYAYSPYHNLKEGTKYPATLVTTADTDDRVVPGHSFKFIAMLQHCQAGPSPVLARIETRAGHGAGKPTSKMIDEVADQLAFLVKVLNIKVR
jgi:prolyl oligopeptidase